MRASATSKIASHAALASAQSASASSNAAAKSDDPTFALMLEAATPAKTKSRDKHSDDQDKQNTSAGDTATGTTQTQVSAQAAAQTPAKAAKDSKTDDKDSDQTTAAATSPDASIDPSAVMTATVQPQAPVPVASANDNDGDDQTVDATSAASKAAAAAAQPAATDNGDDVAPATQDGAAKPTQQAGQTQQNTQQTATQQASAQQATAQQASAQQAAQQAAAALQAKSAGKSIKATDKTADAGTAKPTAHKTVTADAGNAVKAAQADSKTDASAPVAPQPGDTKPTPQAAQIAQAPDLALSGVANAPGVTPADASAPQTVAQHIEVTAQPNVPALAVEIAAKSQSGAKQFDIRLDPPELGRVEVRLSIDATGKASAHLSADQPQTLDLLRKDSTNLTQALRDAGLNVSQDGLNFSLRQQNQNAQDGAGFSGGRTTGRATLAAVANVDTTNATSAYRAPLNGRLDIRV